MIQSRKKGDSAFNIGYQVLQLSRTQKYFRTILSFLPFFLLESVFLNSIDFGWNLLLHPSKCLM